MEIVSISTSSFILYLIWMFSLSYLISICVDYREEALRESGRMPFITSSYIENLIFEDASNKVSHGRFSFMFQRPSLSLRSWVTIALHSTFSFREERSKLWVDSY